MSDYADRFISAREDGYSATEARRIANGMLRMFASQECSNCGEPNENGFICQECVANRIDIELEGDLLRDEGEL